eukprot:2033800-Alexandrium_andersonii.AAC.1
MSASLVGSEMCIRDRWKAEPRKPPGTQEARAEGEPRSAAPPLLSTDGSGPPTSADAEPWTRPLHPAGLLGLRPP